LSFGSATWVGGIHKTDDSQHLTDAGIVNPKVHVSMDLAVQRSLGGASNLWGGRCTTFETIDLERGLPIPHSGWPNPLRIKDWIISELETSLVLFNSGATLVAMHALKEDAFLMKECLLKGNFDKLAACMRRTWDSKNRLAENATTSHIDDVIESGLAAGEAAPSSRSLTKPGLTRRGGPSTILRGGACPVFR
jgi:hypothetical protein